jgi:hypothetical protein
MRTHLIFWPAFGLLYAAFGGDVIAQDRPATEAATSEPSFTTSTSASAIQGRERLKDPEQRKVLRANSRQSIEKEYVLLDQVLTLDANTRSKLFDLLTDLRMESADRYANEPSMRTGPSYPSWEALQAANERERFGDNDLQRSASQATRERQRMRDVLGAERLQQYLDYEMTAFERARVRYFNEQLPADNKLDPSQRERLILLLNERQLQQDYARNLAIARMNGETAHRGYKTPPTGRDAELEELRRTERHLLRVEADSKQLLAQLAGVLTPPQLAVYAANEAKMVAQELQMVKRIRKRAGVDTEKPPVLPPEPVAVVSPRKPLAGRVRLNVTIKVNESAITQRSLLADNGEPVTIEVAPLTIEAVPMLFDDGWREITLKFYELDGKGGRRHIVANTVGAEIMVGAEPVQKLDATALWANRGYAIIGNFTLSAANP